jgi:hypothetical protein
MGSRSGAGEDRPFVEVVAGRMRASVLKETGPRIIGLEVEGFGELLGSTDVTVDGPLGPVPLIGGHRLWSAPEVRESTYVPDTRVTVTEVEGGVRVESDDPRLSLAKKMEVKAEGDKLVVEHSLTNATGQAIDTAAWAISMVRLGGKAVIGAPQVGLDEAGLQARFAIVTWPYTDLGDPRFVFGDSAVEVLATGDDVFKIGAVSLDGRVSYTVDGVTLIKSIEPYDPSRLYADLGAVVQVYVGSGFCEIETIGPMRALAPAESVTHREVWEIG